MVISIMAHSYAKLLTCPLVAKIGTKENAAKVAPIANCVKSPNFGWLNVDRYVLY